MKHALDIGIHNLYIYIFGNRQLGCGHTPDHQMRAVMGNYSTVVVRLVAFRIPHSSLTKLPLDDWDGTIVMPYDLQFHPPPLKKKKKINMACVDSPNFNPRQARA